MISSIMRFYDRVSQAYDNCGFSGKSMLLASVGFDHELFSLTRIEAVMTGASVSCLSMTRVNATTVVAISGPKALNAKLAASCDADQRDHAVDSKPLAD